MGGVCYELTREKQWQMALVKTEFLERLQPAKENSVVGR
jgi:hypothetical protein